MGADGGGMVIPKVAGRTGRRISECAERMRSWITYSTLGCARRAAIVAASSAPGLICRTAMPKAWWRLSTWTPGMRTKDSATLGPAFAVSDQVVVRDRGADRTRQLLCGRELHGENRSGESNQFAEAPDEAAGSARGK